MKVAIGSNIIDNSYGGGNQFAKNLKEYLLEKKHTVVNSLLDKNIDIILITETRKYLSISSFSIIDALIYKIKINQNVKIILRVNENDQRKNSYFMNSIIKLSISKCDHVIFISNYLNKIFKIKKNYSIIHNGANKKIFFNNSKIYKKSNIVKIVTHHWSANFKKGFDIYKFLDENLNSSNQYKLQFTYIGNLPKNFIFKNSIHISPLSGTNLSKELNKHDIYITASLNEPAGMHHIEAACCGLPILYLKSGALPEYCNNYGLAFNKDNLILKIESLYKNYDIFKKNLVNYEFTSDNSNKKYLENFMKIKNIINENKLKVIKLLFFYLTFNIFLFAHRFSSKFIKK